MSDTVVSIPVRIADHSLHVEAHRLTALHRLRSGEPNPDRRLVAYKNLVMPLRGALAGYPETLRDQFLDAVLGLMAFHELDPTSFKQMVSPLIESLQAIEGSDR